jgi:protein-export membrane protein SecD
MAYKWRFYFIIALLLISGWIISPMFINEAKAPYWLVKMMPSTKLKLGLDLQGGTYIVLGVDVDKVVIEHSDRNVERLAKYFEEKKIDIDKIYRVGKTASIAVELKPGANLNNVSEGVLSYTSMNLVSSDQKKLVFDVKDEDRSYIKKKAVEQTIEAIRNRIDEFGVNEPTIQAQGDDRVVVQLPGVKDVERAKAIIGRTAKLEFKLVKEESSFPKEKLMQIVNNAAESGIVYEDGKSSYPVYLEKINEFAAKRIPQDSIILFERKVEPQTGKKFLFPYLLDKVSYVTGEHLKDAYVGYNQDFGEPYVSFQMSVMGAKYMEDLTGKNIGRQLAIILDNNVYSAPVIQAKIGDAGQITLGGGRSLTDIQQEAEDIALVLRAGALPAQLQFEEERVVGPSLGNDSIREGKTAFILGAILVVFFMIVYYRSKGIMADIAVIMNVILILSTLILFGATLTLPGIAGIILTIGMAVDANIIINERIREELQAGNSAKAALEGGYAKALSTVIDANITTAICGIVLLQYGTGPIKGFAVTLLVGIVFSVFTAVYVTKWIFEYMMERGMMKK